jgi:hypothetical protein
VQLIVILFWKRLLPELILVI